MNIYEELADWYWESGVHREGKYALSPSGWMDRLYRAKSISTRVELSRASRRPAMALWGTSQTGKSTLLSSYLDQTRDPAGAKSALSWPGGLNVRFCRESLISDPPSGTVVLNPYNLESDASSCISRFRLAETVDDPLHPVQICLASPIQIMHAIAMGYLTEGKVELHGEELRFNLSTFSETLEAFVKSEPKPRSSSGNRASYERLHRVTDLLEVLVLSGYPRYSALGAKSGDLESARSQLLECHKTISALDAVDRLAFTLFWDSHELLNETFRNLVSWSDRLTSECGGKPVFASPRVVSLLLDTATYSRLHSPQAETRLRAEAKLRELKVEIASDRVTIDTIVGKPLLRDPEEFSLFQGNILELIIPVRKDAVSTHREFLDFLETADLLDCPGTGREQDNRETRLDLADLKPADRPLIFTRLLKRGKTASIVAAYSRDLTIGGFSIFARLMTKPGQPGQLSSGISTWWDAFGRRPETTGKETSSPLPLNLVMSFWGRFFGSTNVDDVRDKGIDAIFNDLDQLGKLSKPEVLTATLAVNYPQLDNPDARLPSPGSQFDAVVKEVMSRAEFTRRFRSSIEQQSFRSMIADGGTNFLFTLLRNQARASTRGQLLDDLERQGLALLRGLFAEALPGEYDDSRFRDAVVLWADRLDGILGEGTNEDVAEDVSILLREMLAVPSELLDPIPVRLYERHGDISPYLETQLARWVEHAKSTVGNRLAIIGLRNTDHAHLALNGLLGGVDESAFADWLLKTLGYVQGKEEGKAHRRYLALRIADCLFPSIRDRPHRSREDVVQEMQDYEARDRHKLPGAQSSPHYRQFVKPFVDHLRLLGENLGRDGRPPQCGDDTLREIERISTLRQ